MPLRPHSGWPAKESKYEWGRSMTRINEKTTTPIFPIPGTIEQATDKKWLSAALAPVSGGDPVDSVEVNVASDKMASIVRIAVRFANQTERVQNLCLKSFFGWERDPTTIREARFYSDISPHISMRVPKYANAVIDIEAEKCVLIMEDVLASGARFRSVLDPFTADETAETLDQLARLHAGSPSPAHFVWLPSRVHQIGKESWLTLEDVQEKLDDPRGETLDARSRDASLLFAAIAKLAAESHERPQTVLHGDCHAGNVYVTADGPGFADWQLVQRGHWSYDVAYHINAVLPVQIAELEERALLDHYCNALRQHGGTAPDRETAWSLYRRAPAYGFFHWAIARSVGPELRNPTTTRLGAAIMRHGTYKLLGL